MAKKIKPKEGDKIVFNFAGSVLEGVIETITKIENKYGGNTMIRYMVRDEKYVYPIGIDNIKKVL